MAGLDDVITAKKSKLTSLKESVKNKFESHSNDHAGETRKASVAKTGNQSNKVNTSISLDKAIYFTAD